MFQLFEGELSEKEDSIASRTLSCHFFQFGAQVTLSDNYIEEIGERFQQIREDLDHGVDALSRFGRDQTAYRQNKPARRGKSGHMCFAGGLDKSRVKRRREQTNSPGIELLSSDHPGSSVGADGKDASRSTQGETPQKRERLPYLYSVGDDPVADTRTKSLQQPRQRREVYMAKVEAFDARR